MRKHISKEFLDTGPVLRLHEGAWVCSYEQDLHLSMEEIQKKLPKQIQILQKKIEGANGIVGHVKVHVSEKGKAMVFSAAGGSVNQMDCSDLLVTVGFTAIAILEDGELLRKSVESIFLFLETLNKE